MGQDPDTLQILFAFFLTEKNVKGKRQSGELLSNGHRVSVREDEKV